MSDAARAAECKQRGGAMFAKGKMAAAIEAYSEAIVFAPGEPVSNGVTLHLLPSSFANGVCVVCRSTTRTEPCATAKEKPGTT